MFVNDWIFSKLNLRNNAKWVQPVENYEKMSIKQITKHQVPVHGKLQMTRFHQQTPE